MKKYIKWLTLCIVVFIISIFLHECGHGIANAISGIPCSTGFNRVGDIYKYPSNPSFREAYSQADSALLDFGVPCTLVLAIVGTIMYCRGKRKKLKYVGVTIAATNSVLRLIPCLMVVLVSLFTGNIHKEDELETGLLLVQMTNYSYWTYIPALFSIIVSVLCIIFLLKKAKKDDIGNLIPYVLLVIVAFYVGMIIVNILDNIVRINWIALG